MSLLATDDDMEAGDWGSIHSQGNGAWEGTPFSAGPSSEPVLKPSLAFEQVCAC